MCRWVCQRIDDLQLLHDRARPAVRDNKRQRIWMFGTNVEEVNIHAINLSDELWQCVQSRLDLAPVVIGCPITGELLHRSELHALRRVRHEFARRPFRCLYALAQFGKFSFRNVNMKGADGGAVFLGGGTIASYRWNCGSCECERCDGHPRGEISACDDACSEFNLIFSFHIRSSICLRFSFFQILFHGFRLILISVG